MQSAPTKQIQSAPTNTVNTEQKNDENVNTENNELPSIRWTDSSNSLQNKHTHSDGQHIHSSQCQHGHDHDHHNDHQPTKPIPTQNGNLLDKLEQETQKALSQQ